MVQVVKVLDFDKHVCGGGRGNAEAVGMEDGRDTFWTKEEEEEEEDDLF